MVSGYSFPRGREKLVMGKICGLYAGSILFIAAASTLVRPAWGADFSLFAVVKQQTYVQNGPSAPLTPQLDLRGDPGVDGFGAVILPNSPSSISSATITEPNPANVTLTSGSGFNNYPWYATAHLVTDNNNAILR
jgi:hypothetical protein